MAKKVLIAPLNWGLGHASRCISIIYQHLHDGDEVVMGGDGESFVLLQKHFPSLPFVQLLPLNLAYSKHNSQIWAMCKALPKIILWAIKEHFLLQKIQQKEHFDLIISDNRFGLFHPTTCSIYITHQLHIPLPKKLHFLENLAQKIHYRVIQNYDECWVPDFENGNNLAGKLSHPSVLPKVVVKYMGPLSRFVRHQNSTPNTTFGVVCVLSGLEPQRTLLEKSLIEKWHHKPEKVLMVQGIYDVAKTPTEIDNITLMPNIEDALLASYLLGTKKIIARSGYSTIMDLFCQHVLEKAELIPTPGQPEQEYLYHHICHNREQ